MVSPTRWIRRSQERPRVALMGLVACLLLSVPFSAAAQQGIAEGDVAEGVPSAEMAPIALAQFTTGIENREPIDQITFVANDVSKIFFFSDLRGLTGKTVVHRWSFQGSPVAEVEFKVGGPRWRVWSSKELKPEWIGDWTVEIVLAGGEVLAAETFSYSAAQR